VRGRFSLTNRPKAWPPSSCSRSAGTIRELKEEGFNIILVEQNFLLASTVTDRHYIVEQGPVIDLVLKADLEANMQKLYTYLGV
jgi:branched-chain amino acid transport system ATP-binding protein